MFDSPFDFFSLVIAIVAFIFARKAFNQAAQLRARIDMSTLTGRLPRAVVHVPGLALDRWLYQRILFRRHATPPSGGTAVQTSP
jgi:hypothetical protein